ncbi:glycoside hydrolase family 3 C-terminal domain-containing protein [Micromonospora sp. RTP1Z1]|uniref:glycoside hydrolase family 3 protein n=1 Tax=Micromonospora sp. RTP1Z1 TaxID=2994043 RepID=UPI0029C93A51|nr:glycoside hydrolase family 3 C-terminal domain-containing protein [Micromonospora sp. RTP1Z1]
MLATAKHLQGTRAAVGPTTTVTYRRRGTGIDRSYRVAIAVVGETPYAEGRGDRTGSMSLDREDLRTISTLRNAGMPVIVVLVSGRPLDIAADLPRWDALLASWLPGTEGGGVADVLFGVTKPTGKPPVTWMNSVSQQPVDPVLKEPVEAVGHRRAGSLLHLGASRNSESRAFARPGEELHKKWAIVRNRS